MKLACRRLRLVRGRGKFVLRTDMTNAFRTEHGMPSSWWPTSAVKGLLYLRKIVAIDETEMTVTLDAPLRYPMKLRDKARAYKTQPNIFNIGIEKLSLGMRQTTPTAPRR